MKTINITGINVQEIRFRPLDTEPNITTFFDVLDDTGAVVGQKSQTIAVSSLPTKARTAITNYLTNLSALITASELL